MIKLRNSILAGLGILLVSAILISQTTRTGHATGGAVAVQITGTPAVSISGTPAVTVSGAATVIDPDDPGKQPFQTSLNPSSSTSNSATAYYTVPAGKELVIDYISAQNTQYPSGGYAYMYMVTTAGGDQEYYKVVPPAASTVPVNQNLKIYADPGTTIQAQETQSSGTSCGGNLIISGHFVNFP
jgi:hypothetical protein